MKILLVNKFHYRRGGAETYYFTLADAFQNSGCETVFFSMRDEQNLSCRQSPYFVSNVDYTKGANLISKIKSGLKLIYSFESAKKMEQLIQQEKPDLAVLNLVHRQITLSIVDVLKKHHIPIFFVAHDMIFACPNSTMLSHGKICEKCLNGQFQHCIREKCVKGSLLKSLLAALEAFSYKWRKTYGKIDLYISPSLFLQNKLQQANFTHTPIRFLRNPLPADTVYRLPEGCENYFLYFGRLSPEKGILTLLKAFKLLPGSTMLRLAGNGPQCEELEQFVKENGLTNRVVFAGFQKGGELQALIENSKCVVLPSEWYENCPYSILEAMAKGRPCIVSNLGGLPELVEDGVTGYIFEAGNVDSLCGAFQKLLSLKETDYLSMCQTALERVKKECSPENYIVKLIQEYKKLENREDKE